MEIDKDKVAIVFDKDLQITVDGTVALISANLQKACGNRCVAGNSKAVRRAATPV